MRLKDRTGDRYGRLVVVRRAENKNRMVHWECVCDCGNTTVVRGSNLQNGTKSCGCLARESSRRNAVDWTGQSFGGSVVVRQTVSRKNRAWWVLRCECGNEFEVSSHNLHRSQALNCGCKLRSRALVPKDGEMACEVPSPNYPDGRMGTYAGYQAHVKIDEKPCPPCEIARTEYNNARWSSLPESERAEVREKNSVATKAYLEKHASRRRDTTFSRRVERVPIIREAKDRPCADCGIQYPYYVMQFDHVRGEKKFNIGGGWNNSIEAILEEIDKCEVVCANCHAERTYQRMVMENEGVA